MAPVAGKIPGFAGGLNLRAAMNQLEANELRDMSNAQLDERGGISKRLGGTATGTVGAGGDRIISSYPFYRGSSSPQLLVHTSAGKLYWTTDFATFTQIATGLSTFAQFSFETFNGKCYFSNGVDAYASWDGAAYTTFAAAPKGKYLRLYKDTMWVSGVTGLDDRVYSSDPGNAEVFGVAAWVDIAKGDGDQVKALYSDGYFLIVWKLRRYWIIYDAATFANRMVDDSKGCESHFSVVSFESLIYFLSSRGICVYRGDQPAQIISDKIDPIFTASILNYSLLYMAWAYRFENRVGWTVPEAGAQAPSLQIEFYPRIEEKPFAFHRMPARCFSTVRTGATERLFYGHVAQNTLLEAFTGVGTDNGAFFTGIAESGWFDMGAPLVHKYIRRIRVIGRGKVNLQLKRDFDPSIIKQFLVDLSGSRDVWNTAEQWGVGVWGSPPSFGEAVLNVDAYGKYFSVRLVDAETGTQEKYMEVGGKELSPVAGEWGVYGVIFEGETLGVRI